MSALLGRRVRHPQGIGAVTATGADGVTVDGVHKVKHGDYHDAGEADDLARTAGAYARWKKRLPAHLALGHESRLGVRAAMAATMDQHFAGDRQAHDDSTRSQLVSMVKALKGNGSPHTFSVRGADGQHEAQGEGHVEEYLKGHGLSRRGLESYHANRHAYEAALKGATPEQAKAHAVKASRHARPADDLDPRLFDRITNGDARGRITDGTDDAFAQFVKEAHGNAGSDPSDADATDDG